MLLVGAWWPSGPLSAALLFFCSVCTAGMQGVWLPLVASLADEPVQIIRAGKSNTRAWMNRFAAEHVVETMNFGKEQAFLRADAATRRTGRLVKMVTVIDMHSSRLSDNDNRFFKALGRASKESELFYPQLLEMTVAINVPSYMNLLWPIAKRIMPAKTLAKFRICGARDTMKESAAKCPFATTVFTPETLVTFLGGSAASTAPRRARRRA